MDISKTKAIYAIQALFLILLPVLPGCKIQKEVTFDQLFQNPASYNGRTIIIEGFYFEGFEAVMLAEGLEDSGFAAGHLWPAGHRMWVEGGIPNEVRDKLNKQNQMGPNELYGKVRVEGKFQYGGKYGLIDGYDAQIKPGKVELMLVEK